MSGQSDPVADRQGRLAYVVRRAVGLGIGGLRHQTPVGNPADALPVVVPLQPHRALS